MKTRNLIKVNYYIVLKLNTTLFQPILLPKSDSVDMLILVTHSVNSVPGVINIVQQP